MVFRVADAHCDYLDKVIRYGYDLDDPQPEQSIVLNDMREGNVALQFFAAWLDTEYHLPTLNQYVMMLAEYQKLLQTHTASMVQLEKDRAPDGRIQTVFTVEDLGAIPCCKELIPSLRHFGTRAVTLTWNYNNPLAGASMDNGNLGLSEYGRETVAELEKYNIAIDVSHLSDRGIDDLLGCAAKPIFASHSNARAIMNMPRTLSDAHIRAISANGGVIGVNFCGEHLTMNAQATMDDIADHILHICEVGGVECCAIGSDFDGIDICPVGLQTGAGLPALAEVLLKRGLHESEVERILFDNLYHYICQFL